MLYHWQLPANFKIYCGGGINFGMLNSLPVRASAYDYYDLYFAPASSIYDYIDPADFAYASSPAVSGKFGINAVVGAAYHFAAVPVVLALDFRPGYGMGFTKYGASHFFDWKLAFAVRYAF